MFCPNCGKEIKEDLKFCTSCGAKINQDSSNKFAIIAGLALVFVAVFAILLYFLLFNGQNINSNQIVNNEVEKGIAIKENVVQPKETEKTPSDILDEINQYQEKYWKIIKRNDILLRITDGDDTDWNNDSHELDKLYEEVKSKIDKNNEFLKKYHDIEKQFSENPGETDFEIKDFAIRNNDTVDKLLNEIYITVKSKLSPEDFEKLKISERKWIKDVNEYHKYSESENIEFEYGHFVRVLVWDCEVNIRSFRALLLMLFL